MIKVEGQTWFTSDWHLGETRMDLMGRPFSGPEEMFQVILKNYNSVVGDNDVVYILGDVCYKETRMAFNELKNLKDIKFYCGEIMIVYLRYRFKSLFSYSIFRGAFNCN